MTTLRLAWRMQRWELAALSAMTVAWVVAAARATRQMNGLSGAHPECFGSVPVGGPACPLVTASFAPWQQFGETLLLLGFVAPFAFGIVLGVPIVARELESRTAAMTWGLAVRRIRWLLRRCWPVAALLVVVLGVIGLVGDMVMTAWETPLDPGFLLYDHRGLLLAVRGLAVFGLALTIGAVLGRTIPALLLASFLAAALALGIGLAIDGQRRGDGVVVSGTELVEHHEHYFGSLVLPNVWVAADGAFTDDPNRAPEGAASAFWLVPPTQIWKWLSIEAVVTLMATAVAGGIGVFVTDRRKPR